AAAAAALALSQPLTGGPARPTPAGPVNPASISPVFIMLCSDLPFGACTTFGGRLSAVTCSSSSATQVTFEEASPYSFRKMPRVHTPVVTEYARTPTFLPSRSFGTLMPALGRTTKPP